MATSIKISQLPAKGSALEATDLLEVSEFNGTGYISKSITGQEIIDSVPSSVTAWGTITGTLSSQTDLNTALSGKVPTTRTLTINGTTQDLSADRTFTVSTGITIGTTAITSGTVGRVLFEGTGNVVSESANLFWDNTNARLGVGTASPTYKLDVNGLSRLTGGVNIEFTSEQPYTLTHRNIGLAFPVPTLRPSTANQVIALDVMPNGTPTEFGDNGFAWIDVVDKDVISTNPALTVARIGNRSSGIEFGSRTFNGATQKPLLLTINGVSKLTVTATGNVDTQNPFNGSSYLRQTNTDSGVSAFSEVGAISNTATGTFRTFSSTYNYDGTNYQSYSALDNNTSGVLISASGASGNIKFLTSGNLVSTKTRMQIFSTGNIGINTTTDAGYKLDVNGTARVSGALTITSNANYGISIARAGTAFIAQQIYNSNAITYIGADNSAGGSLFTGGLPYSSYFGSGANYPTQFASNNAVRMTIFAGGNIAIGTTTDVASAQLQMSSTTQGFLPPRMTTTQKNAITSPSAGLMVYDTTLNLMALYNGTTWITL
jgi:hypothetical protein